MIGHLRGHLKRPVIFQVDGDAHRPTRAIANLRRDVGYCVRLWLIP
jgi:hypothetical protein